MNTPNLFGTINDFLPKANGWCPVSKAMTLASLVLSLRPDVACEIGSYAGKSSIPIALAMQLLGKGTLIAIDPYDPEESARNETAESSVWWKKLDHNAILAEFEGYIQTYGLQNIIQIKRTTSDAFDTSGLSIDLLHIDGAHSNALADAKHYCPCVKQGGFVVMDDLNWFVNGRHTVREATDWMKAHSFVELYEVVKQSGSKTIPDDDWGIFQKL